MCVCVCVFVCVCARVCVILCMYTLYDDLVTSISASCRPSFRRSK